MPHGQAVFQCQIGHSNSGEVGTLLPSIDTGSLLRSETRCGIVVFLNPPAAQQEGIERVRRFIRPQLDATCRNIVQKPVRQR